MFDTQVVTYLLAARIIGMFSGNYAFITIGFSQGIKHR